MLDFEKLRKGMVANQLLTRDICDQRVIDSFLKVPRHEFVDEKMRESAYNDYPLPIGSGQTISQPYMVALMVQCLKLKGGEKVLEVGCGSGYQTAILAELAKEVYSIERIDSLAQKAKQVLDRLGYKNIKIKTADGTLGWQEFAPFDAIIVSAATLDTPRELLNQLKEGARLAIPLGGAFSQMLTVLRKEKNGTAVEEVCPCVFVPLVSERKEELN